MVGNGKYYHQTLWHNPTYLWSELIADGPPVPYNAQTGQGSRTALTFYLDTCTYSFYIGVGVMGTKASENTPPQAAVLGIAFAGSADHPIPEGSLVPTLSGSGSWQARNSDYILYYPEKIDYFIQDNYDLYTILGEDNLGTAQVSWSFTPSEEP
jgi:hypothetical protein